MYMYKGMDSGYGATGVLTGKMPQTYGWLLIHTQFTTRCTNTFIWKTHSRIGKNEVINFHAVPELWPFTPNLDRTQEALLPQTHDAYVSRNLVNCKLYGKQEAQLSPRDRAMRPVNWNHANCHATVQKLLIRQVLTKWMVWSWRFSRRQCVIDNVHSTMTRPSRFHCLRCVINKPTTVELCISPVYRRLAVVKFSKSTM